VSSWRHGLFDEERSPGQIRRNCPLDQLNEGGASRLVLTLDKDANYETMLRIHDWFGDINIAQILYRTYGHHMMIIHARDCTGISGTYVPSITSGCGSFKSNRLISRTGRRNE
jgi:hypothetical protein